MPITTATCSIFAVRSDPLVGTNVKARHGKFEGVK